MEKNKILVITTWSFNDALIQSHTLPYLKIIHEVAPATEIFLVTQEKEKQFVSGPQRQQINAELNASGIHFVPQQYYNFGFRKIVTSAVQLLALLRLILFKKITRIHAFCTPAGATGYVLSILTGRQLILDSYEPHAEAIVENGTWTRKGLAFKILWWLEKKQTQRASQFIAIASGMNQYAQEKYGVHIKKIYTKPSCVDLQKFQVKEESHREIREKLGWQNKIVCIYAGKFGGIYLEKEVFDFFSVANQYWGDQFRVLLLTSLSKEEVLHYCKHSSVPAYIFYIDKVAFDQMPLYLSAADFGFTPVKPVPSKRYCSPIKDGEYWALGLPVVITNNISDDSNIIRENDIGAVLETLVADAYVKAVKKIDDLLKTDKTTLKNKIRLVAEKYRNYGIAKKIYKEMYGES